MFDLTGKRALVTGSTQGIGYAIAKQLAECGAEVYIHGSVDKDKARRAAATLAEELGLCDSEGCDRIKFVTGDLSDKNTVARIIAATGEVDIVVANASVQVRREWSEISDEDYDLQMDVNLRSTLKLMQAYIPAMRKGGYGRFLAIGSVQERRPHTQMAVYAASKCAIKSLVENVAVQVAADGVTVNMIAPGVILTPRNEGALADGEYRARVLSRIPAGYEGEPRDIAAAALLLCSDEGRYITGAELFIDGGMSLGG